MHHNTIIQNSFTALKILCVHPIYLCSLTTGNLWSFYCLHSFAFSRTPYTGWGKSRFIVVSTQNTKFIFVLFIHYCIIFHVNNCKPPFAPHCILDNSPISDMCFCKYCISSQSVCGILILLSLHILKLFLEYIFFQFLYTFLKSHSDNLLLNFIFNDIHFVT